MKTTNIIYWITTAIIFLLEGVLVALTWNTELATEGIRHLGYPTYFGPLLAAFKVLGAIVLILPAIKGRIKEWAYAGFGFVFISAAVSHTAVDGFGSQTIFPIVALGILTTSYLTYQIRLGAAEVTQTVGQLKPEIAV